MNAYNWEVGKTYKTRDGRDAKFIAHVPEAIELSRLVFLVGNRVRTHYEDGKFLSEESQLDILPPKRTVYVGVMKDEDGRIWALPPWDSEKDACRFARTFKGSKLLAIAPVEIDA